MAKVRPLLGKVNPLLLSVKTVFTFKPPSSPAREGRIAAGVLAAISGPPHFFAAIM